LPALHAAVLEISSRNRTDTSRSCRVFQPVPCARGRSDRLFERMSRMDTLCGVCSWVQKQNPSCWNFGALHMAHLPLPGLGREAAQARADIGRPSPPRKRKETVRLPAVWRASRKRINSPIAAQAPIVKKKTNKRLAQRTLSGIADQAHVRSSQSRIILTFPGLRLDLLWIKVYIHQLMVDTGGWRRVGLGSVAHASYSANPG